MVGRSILAIVSGFVAIALLSLSADRLVHHMWPGAFDAAGRTDSVGMLTFTLAYVALFAVLGCYLAARLAPNRPMSHALVLGLLGVVFTGVGTIGAWATAPAWYHVADVALVMPYAWVGGHLRMLQIEEPRSTNPRDH